MIEHDSGLKASWVLSATDGINYVRAEQPAKYLPGRTLRLAPNAQGGLLLPKDLGVVIMQFPGLTHLGTFARFMQAAGYPVVFEVDDNYRVEADVPETSSWKRWPDKDGCPSYDIAERIAEFSDAIIVSTPHLADVYADVNDQIFVCRNCVDPTDWPEPPERDDGKLRVGWSGSGSHEWDAPLLLEAFRWLYQKPDVEIVVWGYPGFDEGVTHVPWVDSLEQYRRNLMGIDVMLCPLNRTPFADGRSDLKALEGVMAGAAAVVADSPAYDLWGDKTHVVSGPKGWLDVVKHLYVNRDELEQMKALQRAYVLGERTIEKGVAQWEAVVEAFGGRATSRGPHLVGAVPT